MSKCLTRHTSPRFVLLSQPTQTSKSSNLSLLRIRCSFVSPVSVASTTRCLFSVRRDVALCRFFGSSTFQNNERQVLLNHLSNNDIVPGGVVSILTLNRPGAANAMSKTMLLQLKEALAELDGQTPWQGEQQRSRCVVLASSSPRVFSAGADLKERRTMSLDEAQAFVTDLRQTMHRVSELPMPVIAALSGSALGGGLELALCADIRIASESAVLGLVETSLAIIPGAGGTQRLPRLIGLAKAKELVFTAAKLSARQALDCGLVDYVVEDSADPSSSSATSGDERASSDAVVASSPPSPVLDKALELAWKIASNGPLAVQAAKRAMDGGMFATSMQAALDLEEKCYSTILTTEDRLEGLAAFADKRKPHFTGK
ncbi:hypothetical protein ACA910_000790 [Epithemia clementina (nom. ined.)]